MKIILETPEEIDAYLSSKYKPEERKSVNPLVFPKLTSAQENTRFTLRLGEHWSTNTGRWVRINNMDSNYILNIIRKMFNAYNNNDLLGNKEFLSLIVNLADKIVTD